MLRAVPALALALPVVLGAGVLPAQAAPVGSWFHDPLTTSQRAALVPVPEHPRTVRGTLHRTQALYKTHGGGLAVPAVRATGHQLSAGQAVTLSGRAMFRPGTSRPTKRLQVRLATLAGSLTHVTALRCEGYTDFGGDAAREGRLARKRALAVCDLLAAARPSLATRSFGFGRHVPVVVGGKRWQRAANRRVVVVATQGVATPGDHQPPQQASAPGAPALSSVTGTGHAATLAFSAPASSGSSPITGYEWSTDLATWTPLPTTGSSPFSVQLSSLPVGAATYYVRAVNAVGHGPASSGMPGTVLDLPNAPSIAGGVLSCGTIIVWFYPGAANSATVTGFEFSTDDGETWTTAQNVVNPSSDPNETQRRFDNSVGGGCVFGQGPTMLLRATSANGPGPSAAPYELMTGP